MHHHRAPPPAGRPRPPPQPPPQWAAHPPAAAAMQGARSWLSPPPLPPQAMGGPPRYAARPMMMAYAPPRQYYAPPGPRFVRPPPPLPVDPDALWLQSFERQHLQGSTETSPPKPKRQDPPLRQVRVCLARMQTLLEQLRNVAGEVVELENRLRAESGAQELELTRLRAQRDRKRAICAGLKFEIEELASHSIHLPPDQLAEIKRFAQRVQLKKKARREARTQRQAESAIHRAMAVSSTESDESKRKQEPQEKEAELSELEQQSARQSTMLANEKRLLEERERARQVLLLLDLKEQRRRDERTPLDAQERVWLQQTREMAMKCLEKRAKRPRTKITTLPEHASQPQNAVQSKEPMPQEEPCNALTDPETINMETLIARRSHWDRFLVSAPNVPGASSIPSHFVAPLSAPNDSWATYLHAETT